MARFLHVPYRFELHIVLGKSYRTKDSLWREASGVAVSCSRKENREGPLEVVICNTTDKIWEAHAREFFLSWSSSTLRKAEIRQCHNSQLEARTEGAASDKWEEVVQKALF